MHGAIGGLPARAWPGGARRAVGRMSWLPRTWRKGNASAAPDPDFAYRVVWTKEARTWDAARRAVVARAVREVLRSGEFQPNAYNRRYRISELDDLPHSGASLVALREVLEALEDETK